MDQVFRKNENAKNEAPTTSLILNTYKNFPMVTLAMKTTYLIYFIAFILAFHSTFSTDLQASESSKASYISSCEELFSASPNELHSVVIDTHLECDTLDFEDYHRSKNSSIWNGKIASEACNQIGRLNKKTFKATHGLLPIEMNAISLAERASNGEFSETDLSTLTLKLLCSADKEERGPAWALSLHYLTAVQQLNIDQQFFYCGFEGLATGAPLGSGVTTSICGEAGRKDMEVEIAVSIASLRKNLAADYHADLDKFLDRSILYIDQKIEEECHYGSGKAGYMYESSVIHLREFLSLISQTISGARPSHLQAIDPAKIDLSEIQTKSYDVFLSKFQKPSEPIVDCGPPSSESFYDSHKKWERYVQAGVKLFINVNRNVSEEEWKAYFGNERIKHLNEFQSLLGYNEQVVLSAATAYEEYSGYSDEQMCYFHQSGSANLLAELLARGIHDCDIGIENLADDELCHAKIIAPCNFVFDKNLGDKPIACDVESRRTEICGEIESGAFMASFAVKGMLSELYCQSGKISDLDVVKYCQRTGSLPSDLSDQVLRKALIGNSKSDITVNLSDTILKLIDSNVFANEPIWYVCAHKGTDDAADALISAAEIDCSRY